MRHAIRCERDNASFRAVTIDQTAGEQRRGIALLGQDSLLYDCDIRTSGRGITVKGRRSLDTELLLRLYAGPELDPAVRYGQRRPAQNNTFPDGVSDWGRRMSSRRVPSTESGSLPTHDYRVTDRGDGSEARPLAPRALARRRRPTAPHDVEVESVEYVPTVRAGTARQHVVQGRNERRVESVTNELSTSVSVRSTNPTSVETTGGCRPPLP